LLRALIFSFSLAAMNAAFSQVLTREDSLAAGLVASNSTTVISGYGSFKYTNNLTLQTGEANVDRVVVFIGHKFTKRISFFSETELENARVVGGQASGEISMEQAFLKFNIDRNNYITAGLFIPRIGIINENHLPTTFNGNERPYVEQLIIPATWREIGVGYYGTSRRIPGLNYSFALLNGLNSQAFTNGTGIADGRFEGSAQTRSLAVTGSLLYYYRNFRVQASAYFGGSAGIPPREADSLQLASGAFGSPVELLEANIQYNTNRFSFRALASYINIASAAEINRAYANNTPGALLGFYGEASYNLTPNRQQSWIVFGRYEQLNMNLNLPANAIINKVNDQQYVIAGIGFQPVKGVFAKLDYTYRLTGDINPQLIVTPYPVGAPYFTQQHLIKLGLGYSF
jgi:hypothetical protein